mmetsp:Transcript_6879/g.11809  ORF Transcript_6879/g.11809 Transcript_6879/m.11809 type:complete len:209 (+) Transcript_6879:824-1450(+)
MRNGQRASLLLSWSFASSNHWLASTRLLLSALLVCMLSTSRTSSLSKRTSLSWAYRSSSTSHGWTSTRIRLSSHGWRAMLPQLRSFLLPASSGFCSSSPSCFRPFVTMRSSRTLNPRNKGLPSATSVPRCLPFTPSSNSWRRLRSTDASCLLSDSSTWYSFSSWPWTVWTRSASSSPSFCTPFTSGIGTPFSRIFCSWTSPSLSTSSG